MIKWRLEGRWRQAYLSAELFGEYRQRGDGTDYHVRLYSPQKTISAQATEEAARSAITDHIEAYLKRAERAGLIQKPD